MANAQQSLVAVVSNEELLAREAAAASEKQQQEPLIVGLAGYVRECFFAAKTARQSHEEDMLSALRARSGQYDPAILAEIKKQGGSEIYMRVTATKMRGAQSWLKDIFLTIERPWTLSPTPVPELKEDVEQMVFVQLDAISRQAAMQGMVPTEAELRQLYDSMLAEAEGEVRQESREITAKAEEKVHDLLTEGDFYKALDDAITDITTFKVCCIKGPVVRMQTRLQWTDTPEGRRPTVVKTPVYKFQRVSPLNIYPAPNSVKPGDGYIIERHKLFRQDLVALIGTPGFDEAAVRKVLEEFGQGGHAEWLSVDSAESVATRSPAYTNPKVSPTIDALEYWGSVQGRMLLEWGMSPGTVDPGMEYNVNVWSVGPYVLKAVINHDPLGRVPYSITSYVKIPGTVWGEGLHEQLRDVQQVCNASARSLVNNMGISSGPQVVVRTNRLPPGESITSMYPWKIWQTTDELSGNNEGKPIDFFQPESTASELSAIYDKFTMLADEYSSIPRYMMGDQNVGGAGRTAAGLSMLMNAANKGIKNVANNLDTDVIVPTIERLYYFLMLYDEDESLKGDMQVRARGASGLMLKELVNQRRLEFLQLTTNPVDLQIVKPEGRAAILREIAKGLELNTNDIVPSAEEIRRAQAEEVARQQAEAGQGDEEDYEVQYDGSGRMTGMVARSRGTPAKPKEAQTQDQQMRSQSTGPKLK